MMNSFEMDFRVPRDLPCFAGHFPVMPLLPGALLLDWAIAEMMARWGVSMPVNVKQCKFLQPVLPGDPLKLRVSVIDERADFVWTNALRTVCAGALTLGSVA